MSVSRRVGFALPVYAAADTHAKAERAIRAVLQAYLEEHPMPRPQARVRVARVTGTAKAKVDVVGVAALVGAGRSASKARASRANGRLGGDEEIPSATEGTHCILTTSVGPFARPLRRFAEHG